MRAKFIYETFKEDSDPIEDMGIGAKSIIKKALTELHKLVTTKLHTYPRELVLHISDYGDIKENIKGYKIILEPFFKRINIKETNMFRTYIDVVIKDEYRKDFFEAYKEWVKEKYG